MNDNKTTPVSRTYDKCIYNSMADGYYVEFRLPDGRTETLSDPRAVQMFEARLRREGLRLA